MKAKAIDIETIPDESVVEMLPEPEVKLGNTKDPAKIKEKINEAKRSQIDKMALNPLTARICSVSFCYGYEREDTFKVIEEISDAAEIEILNYIVEELNSNDTEVMVSWNGMDFDLPFIYKRALMLRIDLPGFLPPLTDWTKRYTTHPHCDLLKVFSGWSSNTTGMNLDFVSKRFLGRGKTTRDYSTYTDLIKSGEGFKIGQDNLCDTVLTYDLYQLFKGVLF